MGLSRMTKACRECLYRGSCEYKKMEALAYLPDPLATAASASMTMSAGTEIMAKHDYREIYIDKDTRVTIDLEEVKEQLRRDLCKSLGIGFVMGG